MIKQAIIPLAGLGTRLLPLTSVFAKELLPVNGKPGIEYIIDECIEAGIKEIIFIISNKKLMIKKYFYNDKFFKKIIKKKKNKRITNEYKKILKYKKMIKFVFQNKPLGTGDAILKTKRLIKDKFFLMLLPDDLIIKDNCSKTMISIHNKYQSSVIASMNVSKKNVSRWGIFNIKKKIDRNNFIIKDVVEKQTKGKGGEIHITDSIQSLIKENNKFIGHIFSGKYLDCGTMEGYIKSSMEISKI